MDLIADELKIPNRCAQDRFTLKSLYSFSKVLEKSFFYMCIDDKEDEYAIWRVQFDNDVATYLSCNG